MLTDLFQFDFLLRSFEAGLVIGVLAPLIGTFLVVRRFSLLSDTLAHVSLLGVGTALFFGWPPFLGAIGASLLGAYTIEKLRQSGKVFADATLALFLSGSLALALILISQAQGLNANLLSYLFGSLSTVTAFDLFLLLILLLAALLFIGYNYRGLFLISIDESLAHVSGIKHTPLNTIFILIAAGAVAASLPIVGALLVGALMVIPVLAAIQWRIGFFSTPLLAVFFSLLSVFFGFLVSYAYNFPSGATIVMVTTCFFVISYTIRQFRFKTA